MIEPRICQAFRLRPRRADAGLAQDWPRTDFIQFKEVQRTSWVEKAPKDGLNHFDRWSEAMGADGSKLAPTTVPSNALSTGAPLTPQHAG